MDYDFRLFKDMIQKLEKEELKEYTEVASSMEVSHSEGNFKEDYFFFSVLCDREKITDEKLLEKYGWDVRLNFSCPSEYSNPNGTSYVQYGENKQSPFSPFIIHKNWAKDEEKSFELVQHFLLFHVGNWRNNEYIILNDIGDEIVLVKHEKSASVESLQVHTMYLYNFLAICNSKLILYFEVKRFFSSKIDKNRLEEENKTDRLTYNVIYYQENRSGENCISRILGKQIILGFDVKRDFEKDHYLKDKNPKYIISIDKKGNEVTTGIVDSKSYLTPIIFKDSVLSEYVNQDDKYKINENSIGKKNIWTIPYSITAKGNIAVYLGDLNKLPHLEQQSWRKHNIIPHEDRITEETFLQDINAKFSEPTIEKHPLYHLKKYYNNINTLFEKLHKEKLFLSLHSDQQHIYNNLFIFSNPSDSVFRITLTNLFILFIDCINFEVLKSKIIDKVKMKQIESDRSKPKNLSVLEFYLNEINIQKVDQIVLKHLDALRELRNAIAAHRADNKYEELLNRKYGGDNNQQIQQILIFGIIDDLKLIESILSN